MTSDTRADEPDAEPASEPGHESGQEPGSSSIARLRGAALPVGLPMLLAIALLTLLGTSARLWYDGRDPATSATSAAASTIGRTAATTFFTLDSSDVNAGIDRLLEMSTGQFRTEYAALRDRLVEQVEKKGLAVTATVPDRGTALEFLDDRRAQVLVAIDTTTTLGDGGTELDNYRVRVVLARVDDTWLVSGMEQVG